MIGPVEYSPRERAWLWTLAVLGFAGLNGAFVYGLAARPGTLTDALANPVAVAFILEALVLVGVFAWLLQKWRVSRLHWGGFVFLSLLGGLLFAVPVALLWGATGSAEPGAGPIPGSDASRR